MYYLLTLLLLYQYQVAAASCAAVHAIQPRELLAAPEQVNPYERRVRDLGEPPPQTMQK